MKRNRARSPHAGGCQTRNASGQASRNQGYIHVGNSRWRHFDPKGKVVKEMSGGYNDVGHAQNFLDCMRSRKKPNADLETVGHPSSLLCHIGNAAWRTGRTLRYDDQAGKFTGDADADQYITRPEYRKDMSCRRCERRVIRLRAMPDRTLQYGHVLQLRWRRWRW